MTWLTYILIAGAFVLIALPLLAVAIGRPSLKHHLDEQTRRAAGDEVER